MVIHTCVNQKPVQIVVTDPGLVSFYTSLLLRCGRSGRYSDSTHHADAVLHFQLFFSVNGGILFFVGVVVRHINDTLSGYD